MTDFNRVVETRAHTVPLKKKKKMVEKMDLLLSISTTVGLNLTLDGTS